MTRRAAIYVRVSTDDKGQDVGRQITECEMLCRNRDWSVERVIEDKGSGRRSDRPGFQQLCELVRSGKINAVVVWALDRLSRSLKDMLEFGELVRKHGVDLVSRTHGEIDTSGPFGEFQLSLLGALARLESRIIGERVRSGMAEKKLRGVKFGGDRKSTGALAAQLQRRAAEIGMVEALDEIGKKAGSERALAALAVLNEVKSEVQGEDE